MSGDDQEKINFWFFVPKSGVAFVFLSVIAIFFWNNNKDNLAHPYVWIGTVECILFAVCLFITDKESKRKIK